MKQNKNIKKVVKTTKKTSKTVKPVVKQHGAFVEAIIKYWRGYFDFKGATSRKDFWWAVLFIVLLNLLFSFINIKFLAALLAAVLFVPSRAMAFRRYHDAGLSGFFNLIPYLIFFVWASIRSDMWMFAMNLEIIPTDLKVCSILAVIWWVFNLVVILKPSKLKNNKYRK